MSSSPDPPPLEPDDFYWESGRMVFTAAYLAKRGFCCRNGCRHCPYGFGPAGLLREQEEESQEKS